MQKECTECGKKFGLFDFPYNGGVCYECYKKAKEDEPKLIERYIEIQKSNNQEIESLRNEKYVENNFSIISNNEKNLLFGITYIKNNSVDFLEEMISVDEFKKQDIKTKRAYVREPIKIEIKFDSIQYYEKIGNIESRQKITGSGGGSSIGGALLGGFVAGGVGAIIGSREGIDINTTYEEADTRKLIIKTADNIEYTICGWQLYFVLFDLIPEKEYEIYKSKISQETHTSNIDNSTIQIEKLEKLAKLKENGFITEQEFEDSKKKILDNL